MSSQTILFKSSVYDSLKKLCSITENVSSRKLIYALINQIRLTMETDAASYSNIVAVIKQCTNSFKALWTIFTPAPKENTEIFSIWSNVIMLCQPEAKNYNTLPPELSVIINRQLDSLHANKNVSLYDKLITIRRELLLKLPYTKFKEIEAFNNSIKDKASHTTLSHAEPELRELWKDILKRLATITSGNAILVPKLTISLQNILKAFGINSIEIKDKLHNSNVGPTVSASSYTLPVDRVYPAILVSKALDIVSNECVLSSFPDQIKTEVSNLLKDSIDQKVIIDSLPDILIKQLAEKPKFVIEPFIHFANMMDETSWKPCYESIMETLLNDIWTNQNKDSVSLICRYARIDYLLYNSNLMTRLINAIADCKASNTTIKGSSLIPLVIINDSENQIQLFVNYAWTRMLTEETNLNAQFSSAPTRSDKTRLNKFIEQQIIKVFSFEKAESHLIKLFLSIPSSEQVIKSDSFKIDNFAINTTNEFRSLTVFSHDSLTKFFVSSISNLSSQRSFMKPTVIDYWFTKLQTLKDDTQKKAFLLSFTPHLSLSNVLDTCSFYITSDIISQLFLHASALPKDYVKGVLSRYVTRYGKEHRFAYAITSGIKSQLKPATLSKIESNTMLKIKQIQQALLAQNSIKDEFKRFESECLSKNVVKVQEFKTRISDALQKLKFLKKANTDNRTVIINEITSSIESALPLCENRLDFVKHFLPKAVREHVTLGMSDAKEAERKAAKQQAVSNPKKSKLTIYLSPKVASTMKDSEFINVRSISEMPKVEKPKPSSNITNNSHSEKPKPIIDDPNNMGIDKNTLDYDAVVIITTIRKIAKDFKFGLYDMISYENDTERFKVEFGLLHDLLLNPDKQKSLPPDMRFNFRLIYKQQGLSDAYELPETNFYKLIDILEERPRPVLTPVNPCSDIYTTIIKLKQDAVNKRQSELRACL